MPGFDIWRSGIGEESLADGGIDGESGTAFSF